MINFKASLSSHSRAYQNSVPPEPIFNTGSKSIFIAKSMLIKGKLCYHVTNGARSVKLRDFV